MENREKRKDILIVILMVIIFILIGVLFAKLYFKKAEVVEQPSVPQTNNQQQNNTQPQDQTSVQPKVEEEKELTDVYVKNDISKKASIMLTLGYTDTMDDIIKFTTSNTNKDLKILNLTNKEKLEVILTANKDRFRLLNATEVKEKLPSLYNSNEKTVDQFLDDCYYCQIIEGSVIDKEYMNMFNEASINIVKKDFETICPTFQYDEKTDYYISSSGCGGTGYPFYQFDKYKYTVKGNNIFVYVATSVTLPGMKVYKGIVENSNNYLYTATSDEEVINDMKSNPQKYGLYKLTFEKNSEGTYYYKTTEKIN